MITESAPKSSITVDTDIQKYYNPTGVHNFTHTYQPTLNTILLSLFLGRPADGG